MRRSCMLNLLLISTEQLVSMSYTEMLTSCTLAIVYFNGIMNSSHIQPHRPLCIEQYLYINLCEDLHFLCTWLDRQLIACILQTVIHMQCGFGGRNHAVKIASWVTLHAHACTSDSLTDVIKLPVAKQIESGFLLAVACQRIVLNRP